MSCATNNNAVVSSENNNFTYMQKLFAEKAVKPVSQNNPMILHEFTADPCVLVYNDTVYVYGSNDSQQAEFSHGKIDNGYEKINSLKVYSSKDLVNWTDHGQINAAGKNGAAKWANNSWAPAICTKKINGKDKFFLYFADSANGIGVLSADSPLGPFVDPIGKALVNRSTKNCAGVYWMFDPAVLVDDDGKGYLYFGGGVQNDVAHPKSARVVALNDDMISLAGDPVELDPPFLFEDSGINKINGKYYYSYCTNWNDRKDFPGEDVPPVAVIAYMTSDNPMGPFTYQGYALKNPGTYFGNWGNNHHWLFEFKGKFYMAYHAQIVEKTLGFEKGGYRSLVLNEFKINSDGSWPLQSMTKTGVEPVAEFNPYEEIPAATMHSSSNIIVTDNETLCPLNEKGFVCLKNACFNDGNASVRVKLSGGHKGGSVSFYSDTMGESGLLGTVKCLQTADETVLNGKLELPENSETHNLYIVLEGDVELISWSFSK